MSQKELQRVKVMENAAGGRLSVREASRLLHLSERQVRRLKRRYQPDSIDWVHHGNLGRSMPWAVSSPQKQLILTLGIVALEDGMAVAVEAERNAVGEDHGVQRRADSPGYFRLRVGREITTGRVCP